MRILVLRLPALDKSIALPYDDNVTDEVAVYLVDVPKDQLNTIPPDPGEQHRVEMTSLMLANIIEKMLATMQKLREYTE
jgi:hypothetical protein